MASTSENFKSSVVKTEKKKLPATNIATANSAIAKAEAAAKLAPTTIQTVPFSVPKIIGLPTTTTPKAPTLPVVTSNSTLAPTAPSMYEIAQKNLANATANRGMAQTAEQNAAIRASANQTASAKEVPTGAQDAKVNRTGQGNLDVPNTAPYTGNTAKTWTESEIQADVVNWYKDKLLQEQVQQTYVDPQTGETKVALVWKPVWKNYADWALQRYGAGAPGLAVSEWGPVGPGAPLPPPTAPTAPLNVPQPIDGSGTEQTESTGFGDLGAGQGPANWTEQYHVPGAPDWWRGVIPDITNPELEYASLLNSMIPFLSSEDQRSIATNLAMLYPDVFGMYNATLGQFQLPVTYDNVTGRRINTETDAIGYQGQGFSDQYMRDFYSRERAQEMLSTLDVVKSKMQKVDGQMGPGYTYLQQIASAIRDFGGSGNSLPTRQQFTQLLGTLDTLIATTESDSLSAFGPVSKMITTPFMTQGAVVPISKQSDGTYIFGTANKQLF